MTDLKPDTNSSDSSEGTTAGNSPLRGLYKMSTTAGLGSADYVAINVASILAFLLGIASISAVVFGLPLLIVPLAAIVVGIVGIIKVNNSNGTQTGRLFAIIGLVLAVVFAGMLIVRTVQNRSRQHADEQQIDAIIQQLGTAIIASDYDKAYTLFSERFTQRISKTVFDSRWKPIGATELLGPLKTIGGNGEFAFDTDPTSDIRYARTMLMLTFEKSPTPSRLTILLRHQNGSWNIEDIPDLFPPLQAGMPGQPPMH
jgi:hypothetical protein